MTPMVIAPPADGPVQWHPRFAAFAAFHGFTPKAARPYRGQTKGEVERPVRYVRENFCPRVRRIEGIADLKRHGARWVRTVADVHIHRTTHERPVGRRVADLAACTIWPASHRFGCGAEIARHVYNAGYVCWDGHRRAVAMTGLARGSSCRASPPAVSSFARAIGCFANTPPRTLSGPAPRSRRSSQAVASDVEQRALAAYESGM